MKKFIFKFIYFSLPILSLIVLGLFLPATPRASTSLIFANKQKDELLQNTQSPRIIFIGGSNLSFGLNSQMIKDELDINPINTAIHADIGIRYMLENTIQYIREKDIIILAPEYHHFYRDYNFMSEELLRTVFDVNLSNIKLLNLQQLIGLIPYISKYSFSKIRPYEYFNIDEHGIYSVNSFNEYGDTSAHWDLPKQEFYPYSMLSGKFNYSIIPHIVDFQKRINRKKAKLFITYPGYQDFSYINSIKQIEKIASEYKKYNLSILGNPERYKISNQMTFNTPYHLNKEGVDHRTRLFIADYKKANLNRGSAITNP